MPKRSTRFFAAARHGLQAQFTWFGGEEVTARDLADLPVARVVARTSLAAVDACREALTLLQRTPLAERATSAEAGGASLGEPRGDPMADGGSTSTDDG